MTKLIIEAAAVLNEDNEEFFKELLEKGVDAVAPEMKKQIKSIDTEKIKKDLPTVTNKQAEIIDFWRVRGYEEIYHCLGMSIDLKRRPEFRGLGLELLYLEQFYDKAFSEGIKFAEEHAKKFANCEEGVEDGN